MRARRRHTPRAVLSLIIVGLLSFAHVAAQIGVAFAAPVTVECCCGEHAADVDCGCTDCLGAVYRSEVERDRQGDSEDAVRPCGQEGDHVTLSVTPLPWQTVPTARLPEPRASASATPAAEPIPDSAHVRTTAAPS